MGHGDRVAHLRSLTLKLLDECPGHAGPTGVKDNVALWDEHQDTDLSGSSTTCPAGARRQSFHPSGTFWGCFRGHPQRLRSWGHGTPWWGEGGQGWGMLWGATHRDTLKSGGVEGPVDLIGDVLVVVVEVLQAQPLLDQLC